MSKGGGTPGTRADAAAERRGGPVVVTAVAGGHRLAALVGRADQPRATVLALHGGSSSKEYFDNPVDPSGSLLRLGPAVGVTVLAVDRPGYGVHGGSHPSDPAARTDLLYAAATALMAGHDPGAGLFLVGHSMGSVSALRMAADPRGADLVGLDLSGTGRQHHPQLTLSPSGRPTTPDRATLGRLIWGPVDLYPPGARRALAPIPYAASEGPDADTWPVELPQLASRVRVPVRYSLAEHEGWWLPGEAGLADVAALFTAAPRVATALEAGGGHNLSLGRTARAHHLRILAFVEECLAGRASARAREEP